MRWLRSHAAGFVRKGIRILFKAELILVFLLMTWTYAYGAMTEVPLYTYHTHPPFIIDNDHGLSYDLANYLTTKSAGKFTFVVHPMSRPKVNKMLGEGGTGVIPWVNPVWFKDSEEKKYLWSKAVFMEDGNAIISRQEKKLVYEGPESIDGLIFGGVHGHVYSGIDDYIKDTARIRRVDTENHIDNFRKLSKGRIDVTLMPKSGADYYIKKEGMQDALFVSPKLHSSFQRRAVIVDKSNELLIFINKVIGDPAWQEIVHRYQ